MTSDNDLLAMVRTSSRRGHATQRKKTSRIRGYLLGRPGVKRCCWCNCLLVRGNATVEHLIPIRQGGQTTRENCRLACAECNHTRDSWTADDPRKLVEQRLLGG